MTDKEEQLFEDRLKKLHALQAAGIDPYPATAERTHEIATVLEQFLALQKASTKVTVVGRVRAWRAHGQINFGNVEDGSGNLQFVAKADELGSKKFNLLNEYLDLGDFLELTGGLLVTKRGEKSLLVKDFKFLAKSLRALPEKWHGLTDVEQRLRKRYLDMLANPEVRKMFFKKAKFWESIRAFLKNQNFLEVELPVLETVPGGAEAEPFVTHHNALDQDFYLRISLELPLKRLLVGGFERVFEIGRIFRNEGLSAEHLQDYTQMEFYWAYADFEDLKNFLQKMYRSVVKDLFGVAKVTSRGTEVDWDKDWKIYDYYTEFKKYAGVDLGKASDKDLETLARELKLKVEKFAGRGRVIDLIYKKLVRPKLIEPGFLVYPPAEIEPLAKRWPEDPKRVQRLQVMAWGTELGKGFAELNDPVDQRQRFEEQMKLRELGDKEAQQLDADYVEAMEYGMPPTAGFGLSERLFAILMDKPMRETIAFPPMREN